MLRTIRNRLWLAWNALRGRQGAMYRNLLLGKPVAYRVQVDGTMIAGPGAIVQEVNEGHVQGRGNGFELGPGSMAIGCAAVGWSGYGFDAGNRFFGCFSQGNVAGGIRAGVTDGD